MVRREEQPRDSRASVLLDVRVAGHRGEGAESSFEWAVSAAASVSRHLSAGGYKLRLVTASADLEPGESGDGAIMDYLAGVHTERRADVAGMAEQLSQRGSGGLIVAVLGVLTLEEARRLAGMQASGATCVALLLDSTSWQQLPPTQRQAAERAFHDSTLALMRGGWRVVPVGRGADLATAWSSLARGDQGFAVRAPMAETVSGGLR